MKPILYQSYTKTEIIAFFPGKSPPVVVADAFLVSARIVVCLANTASSTKVFNFDKAGELIWAPEPRTPDTASMVECRLPGPLDKAFAATKCQRLLFVTNDDANFEFVGNLGLSFVALHPSKRRVASFHLAPKLSRDGWSRYGAYSDWQLIVNGRKQKLPTGADIDAALAPEGGLEVVDVMLTRYEGDLLHLVANGESATVIYTNEETGVGMSSRNANYSGKPRATIHLTGFDYADWDTSARNIVSRREALDLLKAFFMTGKPQGLVTGK